MNDQGCNYNHTNNSYTYSGPEIHGRFVAYLVLMVLSTFANTLVIITFIIERSLYTTFNIFILNLAIVDLLTSIFRMGFNTILIGTATGIPWPYGQPLCDLDGIIQSFVYVANIYILMAIAICRYIAIVLSKSHLITKKVVYIIMAAIWLFSMAVSLMPVFGWNRYCYQPLEFACLIDWFHESSFPTYVMVTEFIIPMITLVFCYVGILINLRQNSYRYRTASSLEDNKSKVRYLIAQREAKVTVGMFILFLTFVVCFAPYSITMFVLASIFQVRAHKDLVFFCGFMANFNSLCNPIIYAIWQKRFRRAYCRILFGCCPRFKYNPSYTLAQEGTGLRLAASQFSSQNTASPLAAKDRSKRQRTRRYQKRFSFIFNDYDINN